VNPLPGEENAGSDHPQIDGVQGGRTQIGRSRLLLGGLGLAALTFGAQQLLTGGNSTRITSSIPWLAGTLVLHDAVLAPLAAVIGWALVRLLRERAPRAVPVIATALFVAAVLTLLALPSLLKASS
jgi:hypothetical protein